MYCSSIISHTLRRFVVKTLALVLPATFIALAFAFLSSFQQSTNASARWQSSPPTPRWVTVGASKYNHWTYTRLYNGSVIAVGQPTLLNSTAEILGAVEIYNPITGIWRETTRLNFPRAAHDAHLLPDGRLLVIGDYVGAYAPGSYAGPPEIFDPATEKWSIVNTTGINLEKAYNVLYTTQPISTLLPNGKVMLVGGMTSIYTLMFDPSTGVVEGVSKSPALKGLFNSQRAKLTILFNGKVLLTFSEDALIFDPETNTWTETILPKLNGADLQGQISAQLSDGSLFAFLFPQSSTDTLPPFVSRCVSGNIHCKFRWRRSPGGIGPAGEVGWLSGLRTCDYVRQRIRQIHSRSY